MHAWCDVHHSYAADLPPGVLVSYRYHHQCRSNSIAKHTVCAVPAGSAALAVADAMSALGRRLHVVMEGWDEHAESGTHFETSISLSKVMPSP